MHQVLKDVLLPNRSVPLSFEKAKKYYGLLGKWYNDLPTVLRAENIALPGQIQLQ